MQGVLKLSGKNLRGDSTHQDKQYSVGNQGSQTSSERAGCHQSLGSEFSNGDKKRENGSIHLQFSLK